MECKPCYSQVPGTGWTSLRHISTPCRLPRRLVLVLLAVIFSLGCEQRGRPRDVLVVSIDTLRSDHVGAYGYPRETTPFIDSLAERGTTFAKAFVPMPATDPSHASLFTGLHPLEHGVLANAMSLSEGPATLAEVLRDNGFFTMGAVAVAHLRREYGFDRGFEVYADEWDPEAPGNDADRRDAAEVNRDALRMVDAYARQRPHQPFFLFVHYFDVHAPYRHSKESSGAPDDDLVARYDAGVRYVDEHLGRVYRHLQSRGLADNLLTVVTSDHGEQLGEHGYEGGHADIYRETVQVPLVFHGRGVERSTISRLVSNVDVPVTILSRIGLSFPSSVSGRDQMPAGFLRSPRARPLLILGYPTYTRSVELIDGDSAFVRNLDYIYREVVVEHEPERVSPGRKSGFRRAQPSSSSIEEAFFPVPLPAETQELLELVVTVDAHLESPECRAELAIELAPRARYLERGVPFQGALRVHYPASTRDRTAVKISPGDCVDGVVFRFQGFEEWSRDRSRAETASTRIETELWRYLLTKRKMAPGDELYDLAADAAMERNLIDEPGARSDVERLRSLLEQEFFGLSRRGPVQGPAAYSEEDLELLRSLGYVQ